MTAADGQAGKVASPWGALGADFGIRLASALVLFGIAMGVVWLGGWAFSAFVALVCARMAFEWERLTQTPFSRVEFAVAAAAIMFACGASTLGAYPWAFAALGAGVVLGGGAALWRGRHAGWGGAMVPYLGLPAVALIWLRGEGGGYDVALWLLFVVWATDSWAMIAGRVFGGPKLIPALSPKKTWSGLAGGVLGALGIGFLVAAALGHAPTAAMAGLIVALSLFGQAGDVLESTIKRRFQAKDAGSLIPGHGGFLDRMDSLLAATLLFAAIRLVEPALPFGAST